MAAISLLNPKAEIAKAAQALAVNISGARGLQDVMKSNLGPKGTMKMLISGSGDIKITKDGNILLHEMQIQHPTASLIARTSTAQDDMFGDGTTSIVLLIGELLKQADNFVSEGVHPRLITEGFELARKKCLEVLAKFAEPIDPWHENGTKLRDVARTALKTKIHANTANVLADICVDALRAIYDPNAATTATTVGDNFALLPDLNMVEIMEMQHKTETDTILVRGLVLDHGGRHPDMPKRLENAYILTCNVSMEYEKSEVNSSFFYKTSEERERFVEAERAFITERVRRVIELKRKVCGDNATGKSFVVINQKGIDPLSLDMFAREGILALRRAKRRNMERLALACGGNAVNSVDDLSEKDLGYAGLIYEYVLGENKFTFVEDCKDPKSVTILVKAPTKHALVQLKDAIRDGLRAVLNAITDRCLVPGAGSFEIVAFSELQKFKDVVEKPRMGVLAFAEALLIIPKTLAMNSGFDQRDSILKMQAELLCSDPAPPIGLDLQSGAPFNPAEFGVYDNYCVKKQIIEASVIIASNLLLVDEIMRAGLSSLKG